MRLDGGLRRRGGPFIAGRQALAQQFGRRVVQALPVVLGAHLDFVHQRIGEIERRPHIMILMPSALAVKKLRRPADAYRSAAGFDKTQRSPTASSFRPLSAGRRTLLTRLSAPSFQLPPRNTPCLSSPPAVQAEPSSGAPR